MRCVVCKSTDIDKKVVDEEIRADKNIILVSVEVLVCSNCGERYYDRATMRKIEELRLKLRHEDLQVEEVGKIFRAHAA
jgi:YgiT-type zinc finger domain-containing protein